MENSPAEAGTRRRGRPASGRDTPLGLEEILDCAHELILADGFQKLSMRRLAEALGVTPRAIYNYTNDKASLVDALIVRVWEEIVSEIDLTHGPIEMLVDLGVRTRRIWLENIELANYAMAVAEPDDQFFEATRLSAEVLDMAGFPDVPLAYSVVQTYTMGSVAVAANRSMSSAYFGRDPAVLRLKAIRSLKRSGASQNQIGVVEARFEPGEASNFEHGLRVVIDGLLHPRSAPE